MLDGDTAICGLYLAAARDKSSPRLVRRGL